MIYLIYADGACENNGKACARAAASFAIYQLEQYASIDNALHIKLQTSRPLYHISKMEISTGKDRSTNNLAEATALATALAYAYDHYILKPGNIVHICMDSQLILGQFLGLYKTNIPSLKKIYAGIYQFLNRISRQDNCQYENNLKWHWIPGTVMKASIIQH